MLTNYLKGKSIILGVSGSISAYKSPLIVRELIKLGATVNVVTTESALKFVTKETLSNLSKNYVITDMFDSNVTNEGAWHIHLAHSADLMLIAPCSATSLAKLVTGNCDNALIALSIALPQNVPLMICPAMDFTMYESKQVQRNIQILKEFGYYIMEPEYGELSSGLIGKGRLPEIENIVSFANDILSKKKAKTQPIVNESENIKLKAEIELEILKSELGLNKKLQGKKVLITAGPTQEKIDDVRYISNFSTGKMGIALAQVASELGADVYLITGPINIEIPKISNIVSVQSAEEMNDTVLKIYQKENIDIGIMTAAVADYRPEELFKGKIKKNDSELELKLIKNPDILANIGKIKTANQFLVGFALESADGVNNAKSKMTAKNCDMIVLNFANKENSGFGGDMNSGVIITKSGQEINTGTITKKEFAIKIFDEIIKLRQ